MISLSEAIEIPSAPDRVWPLLSDPALVASCIPGAALTAESEGGAYQGTVRVKFGPTVAVFRGEAVLSYDHTARRCTIEGRGIDGRGASRALASGVVSATGSETTKVAVEGSFNVTGPLETFANAGGVHLARALLAEFAANMARLVAEREAEKAAAVEPAPASLAVEGPEAPAAAPAAAPRGVETGRPAAAELGAGSLLWRAFLSWVRQVLSGRGRRNTQ